MHIRFSFPEDLLLPCYPNGTQCAFVDMVNSLSEPLRADGSHNCFVNGGAVFVLRKSGNPLYSLIWNRVELLVSRVQCVFLFCCIFFVSWHRFVMRLWLCLVVYCWSVVVDLPRLISSLTEVSAGSHWDIGIFKEYSVAFYNYPEVSVLFRSHLGWQRVAWYLHLYGYSWTASIKSWVDAMSRIVHCVTGSQMLLCKRGCSLRVLSSGREKGRLFLYGSDFSTDAFLQSYQQAHQEW